MSRLPYLRRDDLDDDGRTVWDSVAAARGPAVANDDGALVGPFNAWVHAPHVGAVLTELGATLRFRTSLDRRLLELAVITVGARWRAEFEWWAHARLARKEGVSDVVLDAIARGESPTFAREDERVIHMLANQLAREGRVDDNAYAEAHELLGDTGLVELVSLCGYYTLVSFTLNAFEVPLPPGASPRWGSQG